MNKTLLNTVATIFLGISLVPALSGSTLAKRRSAENAETTTSKKQDNDGSTNNTGQERRVKNLKGGMRYRVRVDEFVDKSNGSYYGGSSAPTITHAWSELLAQALMDDSSCRVIRSVNRKAGKDEQEFEESENSKHVRKTVKKGYMAGAQLGIRPTLTSVKRTGGFGGKTGILGSIPIIGKRDGFKVVMEIVVYDLQTGITIAMKRVEGKSHSFRISLPHLPGNTALGFDKEPDLEKAAADVLKKAVKFCVSQFGELQWISSIARVRRDKRVIIAVGRRDGVVLGQEFIYGDAYSIDDPDYGEFLGYDFAPFGRLKVVKLTDKMATCEIVADPDSDPIANTMRIWIPENL